MTGQDGSVSDPWWASGRDAHDGLDRSEDPFDAFDQARRGGHGATTDGPGTSDGPATDAGETGRHHPGRDVAGLVADAVDVLGRLAAEASRRVAARAAANAAGPSRGAFTRPDAEDVEDAAGAGDDERIWQRLAAGVGPHADGTVCDACPVCIGLRALRQARPDVVVHLSDAAHHLSLALRAFADAQADAPDGLEKIDLDP